MFEIVWSSVLATHTPPMPAVMLSGATPTGVSATTRFAWGSITATEFAAAVNRLAPPPRQRHGGGGDRRREQQCAPGNNEYATARRALVCRPSMPRDGASSAGSCARIARSRS